MKKNRAGKAVIEFPFTVREMNEYLHFCMEKPETALDRDWSHLIPEMPADVLAALRAGNKQHWMAMISLLAKGKLEHSVNDALKEFADAMGAEPEGLTQFSNLFIAKTFPKNNRRTPMEELLILAQAARMAESVTLNAAYQFAKDEPDDPDLIMPVSRKTLDKIIKKRPEIWRKLRNEQ